MPSKPDLAIMRAATPPPAWYLTGNFGTLPGTHFVGTRDNRPLELKVNGQRVLRLEPKDRGNANILGGSVLNQIGSSTHGSVISGGGGWVPCEDMDDGEGCADDDEFLPFYSRPQIINGSFSFIGGGAGNQINGRFDVIVGGQENSIQVDQTTRGYTSINCAIVGGRGNSMTNSHFSFIGGGLGNRMGGYSDVFQSVIGGGQGNHIRYGNNATISGGYDNYIHGQFCNIGGGYRNSIESVTGREVIPEEGDNRLFSTIPGGFYNTVHGDYCFVAGSLARADHAGVFLWADASDLDYFSDRRFTSARNNEFAARATGGVRFVTGNGTGAELPPGGGSWASVSDRNSKENFEPVNAREILRKVAALPLQTWNYKTQPANVRHLGPTSQDFTAAFGLGEDAKQITGIDADGVALAAIQGLCEVLAEKNAEIQQLKTSLIVLQEQLSAVAKEIHSAK